MVFLISCIFYSKNFKITINEIFIVGLMVLVKKIKIKLSMFLSKKIVQSKFQN